MDKERQPFVPKEIIMFIVYVEKGSLTNFRSFLCEILFK